MKKIKSKNYGVGDEFGYNHAATASFMPEAIIVGTEGDDILTGTTGDDAISGLGGNDVINGGSGDDKMMGGKGNDYYEAVDAGDTIVEAAGEGIDSVRTRINYTLGANIEKLYLGGSSAINGSGNDLDNTLIGNAAANVLKGGKGNDTLIGQGGGDTLAGGTGNDTYYVYGANDVVIEDAKEGIDTVISRNFTTTLSANVENLELRGSDAIEGIGNNLNNFLKGNYRDNILSGGAGNDALDGGNGTDTLIGGHGNDVYYVNTKNDLVIEFSSQGHDTVYASSSYRLSAHVENLILTGTHTSVGTGNDLGNTLVGNDSANILNGKGGEDRMIGGKGSDTFVFDTLDDVFIGNSFDTVMDFSLDSNDKLDISHLLSGFDPLHDALSDFVTMVETDKGTMLRVDMDGQGSGHALSQVAFLHDVTGLPDLDALVASGNLIIHH